MYKHTKFLASTITPNPIEVSHWIDLNEDSTGGVIKTFDGKQWNKITSDGTVDDEEQVKIKIFRYDEMVEDPSAFTETTIKESFVEELSYCYRNNYIIFMSGLGDSAGSGTCPIQVNDYSNGKVKSI